MSSHSDSEIKTSKEEHWKKYLKTRKVITKNPHKHEKITETLKALLQLNHRSADEELLMRCASFNDIDRARELLVKGLNPNVSDLQMRTPLHVAAAKGYKDMVELLLQHGANPNFHDIVLNTPLHLAACTSNLPVVVALINHGADINLLDLHGRNPLHLAKGKLEILRKSWKFGAIEMFTLKSQLEEIIEVMISLRRRDKLIQQTECNVDDLQLMKMSINAGPKEEMDSRMSVLAEQLQNFSLK